MTEMKDEGADPGAPAIIPPGDAAPPDGASAARPADAAPRDRTRSLALGAAALLLIVLLLVGSAPFWAPRLPWGAQPDAAQPDAGRIAALEARVARLDAQMKEPPATQAAPPADAAPALAALAQRVDALEHSTAAAGADAASETAALRDALQKTDARLDDVEARLGRIAAAQASDQGADRPLLAALAALRAALADGSPFAGELDSVTALASGNPEVATALEPLAAAAPTGIPSTALLAERFIVETAPAIERAAAAAPPEDAGLGDRVLARMRSLVTIRRLDDDGAGDAPAQAAARARTDVLHGDLAGAVTALKSLSGPPAQEAAPWFALAERRLDAESALAAVMRQVAGRLAQSAQKSSPTPAQTPTPVPAAAPAASEDRN